MVTHISSERESRCLNSINERKRALYAELDNKFYFSYNHKYSFGGP